ncbi:MAG: YifB family Mg chelatase-like AAA ATPase [Puniceicoccales bacterium]|jgi:magnesium chelatase family protein|nr:YifB family Mg chelatase-like AAA ATPase [Puniceicoccales bacterium]
MLSTVSSGALRGVEAFPVEVEVNTGECGEPRLVLVGLPDSAVKESQNRVFSALMTTQFAIPRTHTTVNLSPGDLRKEGSLYDLPIALGILQSTRQTPLSHLSEYIVAGELSLSGRLLPIKGSVALALLARKCKKSLLLPRLSAEEASWVKDVKVFAVDDLRDAVKFLNHPDREPVVASWKDDDQEPVYDVDFSEVQGQEALKRAIEIAVSGGHNLLMVGSPGSGKSMLAQRIPTIMPRSSFEEYLECLNIYSASGTVMDEYQRKYQRPFRSPHHTMSDVGLLGGGRLPGPGEVSLAHTGVLFLDELPEFHRSTLEVLRQPLEDGKVSISRSAGKIQLPAAFMLVAAMNPCPCGYLMDPRRACHCSSMQIQRYRSKISGPLLDRIDIHADVVGVSSSELRYRKPLESSAQIRQRVQKTREIQKQRFANIGMPIWTNARMGSNHIREFCSLDSESEKILSMASERLGLSARAYYRILKVSRTIADMAEAPNITSEHILEALQYRSREMSWMPPFAKAV